MQSWQYAVSSKPGFFTIAGMKPAPGTGVQHKQNQKEL